MARIGRASTKKKHKKMTVWGQGFWSIIHQRWDFWHSDRCLLRRCTPAAPRGAWPAAKSLQCVWNVPLLWKVSAPSPALLRAASWPARSPKRLPILNSPRVWFTRYEWTRWGFSRPRCARLMRGRPPFPAPRRGSAPDASSLPAWRCLGAAFRSPRSRQAHSGCAEEL